MSLDGMSPDLEHVEVDVCALESVDLLPVAFLARSLHVAPLLVLLKSRLAALAVLGLLDDHVLREACARFVD